MSTKHTMHATRHGIVLTGRNTVYGSHLAMFSMAEHRFHTVAEISLPPEVKQKYTTARKDDPTTPLLVVNPANKLMHLQDMLGPGGFPAELWKMPDNDFDKVKVLAKDFTAKAAKVLHNRPFNDNENYPQKPRYLVFGSAGEAHASHYMTHQPDYQLLVQLAAAPAGLTAEQLAAGVMVDLTITDKHEPKTDPLAAHRNKDVAAKVVDTGADVTLKIGPTRWFDTHELNKEHEDATTLSNYIIPAPV